MSLDQDDGTLSLAQAVQELRALSSAQEIADRLHACGVTGVRGTVRTCALARYLTLRVGQRVGVTDSSAWLIQRRFVGIEQVHFNCTTMSLFVLQFDQGMFPDLVEPGGGRAHILALSGLREYLLDQGE